MGVSLIIPVRNGAATIGRAIGSARDQVDEIIVVDDGSEDDLPGALASHDVRLLKNTGKRGPGLARNAGIRAARGDFIAFLDADDELGPGQIAALMGVIRKTGADMAYCAFLMRPGTRVLYPPDWGSFLFGTQALAMHSMLFRRSRCALFSESAIFEDRDWQARMFTGGMTGAGCDDVCCLYDWTGPKERYRHFPEERVRIRKYFLRYLEANPDKRLLHANLAGAMFEIFRYGPKIPAPAFRNLSRSLELLPPDKLDAGDRSYTEIIGHASRLSHVLFEHPVLGPKLSRIPRPKGRFAHFFSLPVSEKAIQSARRSFPRCFGSEARQEPKEKIVQSEVKA